MNATGISVLVVDDSPVVRQVLSKLLLEDPRVTSVHTAPTGELALRKIKKLDPDVVTLDVEMPKLDGLATLERIMSDSPRPVIMVSAATTEGADKTIKALELGAVDFIPKPSGLFSSEVASIGEELKAKVRACSQIRRQSPDPRANRIDLSPLDSFPTSRIAAGRRISLIAIGASTGGIEAIRAVLTELPRDFPCGLVLVQHIPEHFSRSFANRLDALCEIEVKEAAHRDIVRPGRALLAPGHSHMVVRRDELGIAYVDLVKLPPVNGHRPSVDVLFDSVAETHGDETIAVILTGMGRDGAWGMRRLKDRGAFTIAQNKETCAVYGMSKAAIEEGSADYVLPLGQIGRALTVAAGTTVKSKSKRT